jgi:hypothetical protein
MMEWADYTPPTPAAAPAASSDAYVDYTPPQAAAAAAVPATLNERILQNKPQGVTEQLLRQAGLTTRAAIQGIMAGPLVLGDAFNSAVNVGLNAVGSDKRMQPMSESFNQYMNANAPQPQGVGEKAAGFGTSVMAGMIADPVTPIVKALTPAAPAAYVGVQDQAKQLAQQLREKGYRLPPSEAKDAMPLRAVEGVAGSGRMSDTMREANTEVSQELAKKALGIKPQVPLTRDVLKAEANDWIQKGYEPVKQVQNIGVGSAYRQDLGKIAQELGGNDSFPLAHRNKVMELVRNYAYRPDQQGNLRPIQNYTGKDAITEIKALRSAADDNFKPGGDTLLGQAQQRIAKALEDQIERSLGATGPGKTLLDGFRQARTMLAKNFAVGRMLVDDASGTISTPAAASMKAAGEPLTGELNTIAQAGSPLFRRSTGVPIRGATPPLNVMDTALASGGAGMIASGNPVGMAFGGLPLVGSALRSVAASKAGQKSLLKLSQTGMLGGQGSRATVEAAIQSNPYLQYLLGTAPQP